MADQGTDELQAAYQTYADWWQARARTDNPLPPSAGFVLGPQTVLLSWAAEVRVSLSGLIGLDIEHIQVVLEDDGSGGLDPCIDVNPPPSWIPKGLAVEPGKIDEAVQTYVKAQVRRIYGPMATKLRQRLHSLDRVRDDLRAKEIKDMTDVTAVQGRQSDSGEGGDASR